MFERQERVAFLLLLGVACAVVIAHLVLGTLGKQPFARPFTNSSADGELVFLSGTIDQVTITKNRNLSMPSKAESSDQPFEWRFRIVIEKQ